MRGDQMKKLPKTCKIEKKGESMGWKKIQKAGNRVFYIVPAK